MGSRRKARICALQTLYLMDICSMSFEHAWQIVWHAAQTAATPEDFAHDLAYGSALNRDSIDKLIMRFAENWELGRMAAIDRNILRLCTYEMLHYPRTPISVIIDEGVEIAKEYSTNDSGKFVNGILDKIKSERSPET
ncbi:MAG: transcription antitermination factor NusB [Elusimicrobia bacterium]|nr:transcription antitermination factor NusB [Elusimicrobiota bacterium]MBD3412046.1 transcription antitermination factor NusB [Elusimicrobiota bacterium]